MYVNDLHNFSDRQYCIHGTMYICTTHILQCTHSLILCTWSNLLLTTGVPLKVPDVIVDDNTININGNNVNFTLSWGEPFNNLDLIVSYTVSCSGDVTCFATTVTTTRSYRITNLTPMTDYTFSVVATNSIGSGKAGELNRSFLGKAVYACTYYIRMWKHDVNIFSCICKDHSLCMYIL